MREGCERGQEERALELLVAVDVATRRDAESQDDEPLELRDTLTFVTAPCPDLKSDVSSWPRATPMQPPRADNQDQTCYPTCDQELRSPVTRGRSGGHSGALTGENDRKR